MLSDNEIWLVEEAGHAAIQKWEYQGKDALTPLERLIYCMWVADYGMRNAGDLATATDLYPAFRDEGRRLAETLELLRTSQLFNLSLPEFERAYFDKYEEVCSELRAASS